MLESKIGNLFHNDAGNPKRTSPSCGVQLKPDFNPSSAAASYVNSDKSCSKPATYFLPFFMNKPGPFYEEWTTNAHEARPGHHYQVSLENINNQKSQRDDSRIVRTKRTAIQTKTSFLHKLFKIHVKE